MRQQVEDSREGNPGHNSGQNEEEDHENEEFQRQMLYQYVEDDGSYDQGNGEFQYRIEDHEDDVNREVEEEMLAMARNRGRAGRLEEQKANIRPMNIERV